uniref:Protein TAPT1 homolog n=1 Tax=Bracon brevicornis TaxID=1563983 RepID=A0A6V7IAU0_9HYME
MKHAFITRFNELRSTVYREYTVSLAYDMAQTRQETAFSDPSDLVARRMGFIPLPLSVAMGKVICTTLTPSAKPANLILFFLGYLILVALRVLNSLVILGKACDLIASHSSTQNDSESKKSNSDNMQGANSVVEQKDSANCGMAMFSNSAVSLNNVCLNDALLMNDKVQSSCNEEFTSKHVVRAESEPLLPQ